MPYKDPEKGKQQQKKYREENREKINEYKKKYYKKWNEENKDKLKEYSKKYRNNNIDKTNKATKKWKDEHPEDCKRYDKNNYRKNKEKIIERACIQAHIYRQRFKEYKQTLHCEICGISGRECPEILSFHHKDGEIKKDCISNLIYQCFPSKKVDDELAKCICICENCHRIIHDEKRMSLEKRKMYKSCRDNLQWYLDYLSTCKCELCGNTNISCLDFHHKDPLTKKYKLCVLAGRGAAIKTIKAEIDKCMCLCANCHKKIHYKEKVKYNREDVIL